jgi:hypothetical protein
MTAELRKILIDIIQRWLEGVMNFAHLALQIA